MHYEILLNVTSLWNICSQATQLNGPFSPWLLKRQGSPCSHTATLHSFCMDCISWWCMTFAGNEQLPRKCLHSPYKKRATFRKITKVMANSTDSWKQLNWLLPPRQGPRGKKKNDLSFPSGSEIWTYLGIPTSPPHPKHKTAHNVYMTSSHFFHAGSRKGI